MFLIYVTNINTILFSQKRTIRIGKMGAKSETEIITISTNFRFVSYDNDEGIFNVSLLYFDFCLEYLTVFSVLS